jgi:hypothetical protein
MAYATRYRAKWQSLNLSGFLFIDKQDYVGDVDDLKLRNSEIEITREIKNWEDYVVGTRCEFTIANDFTDYFELIDLMTATEREYRIRVLVDSPSMSLFEGFIDVKPTQQKYVFNQPLRLTASSYLSKLKHVYPDSLDTLQNLTYIDIIDEILQETGSSFNIRINALLYAEDDAKPSNKTLFNLNALYTESFWKNNVDRKNSLEILQSICSTFNCFIYWWDGYWYIERFTEIWQTSISYVEYTTGVSYDPSDTGTVVIEARPIQDLGVLQFIDLSQTLQIDPGFRLIQVRISSEVGFLLNMTIRDMSEASPVFGVVPFPNIRSWEYWDFAEPGNIFFPASSPVRLITNPILRQISPTTYTDFHRGVYTRFAITVTDGETRLNIKWKYDGTDGIAGTNFNGWKIVFSWYLRDTPGNNFIVFNESTEIWERVAANEVTGLQTVEVLGSSFDPDNMSCEVNVNIPLGEVDSWDGDKSMVFCIGTEQLVYTGEFAGQPGFVDFVPSVVSFGDVELTTTGEALSGNIIEGSINTDFLNKKIIELDLSDVANLNYKNAVLRGTNSDERTERWTYDDITYHSLIEWILIEKFRLYNVSKQQLGSRLFMDGTILRPFQLFTESKQAGKKFVLTKITFFPSKGSYIIGVAEYDNETEINLV